MDEMLALFGEETADILEELNANLLKLEENPNDIELVNEIFRHAHTMKGMSSAMNFTEMSKLTHKMEDLMDQIREGTEVVTEERIDIFLECIDILDAMCTDYVNEGTTDVSTDEIVAKLTNTQSGGNTSTQKKAPTQKKASLGSKDDDTLELTLTVDSDIQIPSLRAYIFLNKLQELGVYVDSAPKIEDCKDDTLFDGTIVLQCKTPKENIEKLIKDEFIFESFTYNDSESGNECPETESVVEGETDLSNTTASEKTSTEKKKVDKSKQHVRIQSEKIDNIINLVAELVIEKNKLELLTETYKTDAFVEPVEKLDRIISHLQEIVMNVRMIPVSTTFKVFPKEIRKVSKELNKKIDLTILGEDTELDRSIVDHIKDPLIHIIRNSLDHGLETTEDRIKLGKKEEGMLRIEARYEGNQAIIEVQDDGKGIDGNFICEKAIQKGLITPEQAKSLSMKEKVNLICTPGFSTAEKVTSLSGRGVGLDAVAKFIEDINGTLEIDTVVGEGTTVRLYLPLTLGIIQAMLVRCGEDRFAIPLFDIETLIGKDQAELSVSNSKEILIYKEKTYPVIHLSKVIGIPTKPEEEEFAIIVKKGNKNFALMVSSIIGQQEIVIKSLGESLGNVKEFSGATILGDGYICLILDILSFSQSTALEEVAEEIVEN